MHSHPQALGQCAGFLREQLPGAAIVAEPSTADAVRAVAEGGDLGGRGAARRDRHAPRRAALRRHRPGRGDRGRPGQHDAVRADREPRADPATRRRIRAAAKTALVFWGGGDLSPRLARRLPHRVLLARHQPLPDRVAPAPDRARPLHVLLRSGGRGFESRRGRRDRRPGRTLRGGPGARLVPGWPLNRRSYRLHSGQRWPPPYPQRQRGPCRSPTTGGTDRLPTAPAVGQVVACWCSTRRTSPSTSARSGAPRCCCSSRRPRSSRSGRTTCTGRAGR